MQGARGSIPLIHASGPSIHASGPLIYMRGTGRMDSNALRSEPTQLCDNSKLLFAIIFLILHLANQEAGPETHHMIG